MVVEEAVVVGGIELALIAGTESRELEQNEILYVRSRYNWRELSAVTTTSSLLEGTDP